MNNTITYNNNLLIPALALFISSIIGIIALIIVSLNIISIINILLLSIILVVVLIRYTG